VKKIKAVLVDNLTAPVKWPDRLAHGQLGFGSSLGSAAAWVRQEVLGFAAPNHPSGIERQDAYCSDVKL
jgi:hypothetical protein